jgi:diguanylate cyclase (GGDEF)-like protein
LAILFEEILRGDDVAGRFWGEEFSILLSDTKLGDARIVASKIKQAMLKKSWEFKSLNIELENVTISCPLQTQ